MDAAPPVSPDDLAATPAPVLALIQYLTTRRVGRNALTGLTAAVHAHSHRKTAPPPLAAVGTVM